MLLCFTYSKEKTLGENYKEAYKLWRDRNTMTRLNIDAKALLNEKNYILRAKRITAVEVYRIIRTKYAAATIITQILNEPGKRIKNRRNVNFWKIRMQKQISS